MGSSDHDAFDEKVKSRKESCKRALTYGDESLKVTAENLALYIGLRGLFGSIFLCYYHSNFLLLNSTVVTLMNLLSIFWERVMVLVMKKVIVLWLVTPLKITMRKRVNRK